MSLGSILIVGAILLACGFAGLLVVRLDNPRLLGLGWLGAALGSGGIGAVLLLVTSERFLLPSMVLADVMVLASFVLLHLGVMEVLQLRGVPLAGLLLIFLQTAADLFKIQTHASSGFRITVVGILVAAQAAQTVYLLLRHADPSIRSPARFVSLVLFLLMLWNLLRSVATAAGILIARGITYQVEALTFVLYLAAALGLAFGFFWMTTAGLTAQLEELASTDPTPSPASRIVALFFAAFIKSLLDPHASQTRSPCSCSIWITSRQLTTDTDTSLAMKSFVPRPRTSRMPLGA